MAEGYFEGSLEANLTGVKAQLGAAAAGVYAADLCQVALAIGHEWRLEVGEPLALVAQGNREAARARQLAASEAEDLDLGLLRLAMQQEVCDDIVPTAMRVEVMNQIKVARAAGDHWWADLLTSRYCR